MLKHASREYILTDNLGETLAVPAGPADDFRYFLPPETGAIRDYYRKYGYVVVRGLVSLPAIDKANALFDQEILPSKRFIYRQATANPERHAWTANGFMLNSILNLQSLAPRHFGNFRRAAQQVLTDAGLQAVVKEIFAGEAGKVVQSMYFHGNPVTWP